MNTRFPPPPPVLISYSHTFNTELKRSPLSIVTALVDKIGNHSWIEPFLSNKRSFK